MFGSGTSTHVPLRLSTTSLFVDNCLVRLDLVFEVDRAFSVIDCDDRYCNFMSFAVSFVVAYRPGQTTITRDIPHMVMVK